MLWTYLAFIILLVVNFLLCRSCGHEVAESKYFIRRPSALSKLNRNDTVLGVPGILIQLFENPQGLPHSHCVESSI